MTTGERHAYHYLEACQMLGISPATLRRMALFYEAAFLPLPTGKGGRIYPDQVLKQFQAAKQLVDDRRAGSLENAFRLLARSGAEPDDVLAPTAPQEALEALRAELGALIRREVAAALEAHHGERMRELEKRCFYLEGELRRRDEQPAPRRAWWKLWGK